jgi:hypothetical protein
MFNQLPGCPKAFSGWLGLPELQVKRPVKFSQFAFTFGKYFFHTPIIVYNAGQGQGKC